jgi:hypothetical protein
MEQCWFDYSRSSLQYGHQWKVKILMKVIPVYSKLDNYSFIPIVI